MYTRVGPGCWRKNPQILGNLSAGSSRDSAYSFRLQLLVSCEETKSGGLCGLRYTDFGRYGVVRKTPASSILNALQTSFATLAVAVAVKQMTRSASTSSTKRATASYQRRTGTKEVLSFLPLRYSGLKEWPHCATINVRRDRGEQSEFIIPLKCSGLRQRRPGEHLHGHTSCSRRIVRY